MKVFKSAGFRELNFPPEAVQQIVLSVGTRKRKNKGSGTFFYIPLDVITPDKGTISIVVCEFEKAVVRDDIDASPGDFSICLRNEWDEKLNPIDDRLGDGQHRHKRK